MFLKYNLQFLPARIHSKLKGLYLTSPPKHSPLLSDHEKFQGLRNFPLEQLEIVYNVNYDQENSQLIKNITLPEALKTLRVDSYLDCKSNFYDSCLTLFTRIQALPELSELNYNIFLGSDTDQKSVNLEKVILQNLPISLNKLNCHLTYTC